MLKGNQAMQSNAYTLKIPRKLSHKEGQSRDKSNKPARNQEKRERAFS